MFVVLFSAVPRTSVLLNGYGGMLLLILSTDIQLVANLTENYYTVADPGGSPDAPGVKVNWIIWVF